MKGWIGVDLDGTLAHYDTWPSDGGIGAPVPLMVERVKTWLKAGHEVRIVTARVFPAEDGSNLAEIMRQIQIIQSWCVEYLGQALDVTCFKDYAMISLWDDRAVQVISNTGRRADGLNGDLDRIDA